MPSSDWQPELFTDYAPPARPPWWARYWRRTQRPVVLRLAIEDCLLVAVGAVMAVVVGFCLGVERGRRVDAPLDTPAAAVGDLSAPARGLAGPTMPVGHPATLRPLGRTTMASAPETAGASPDAGHWPEGRGEASAGRSRYVVQVASVTTRAGAAAIQATVQARGLSASVATKGEYHVVYAEGFSSYAEATIASRDLRATYRDCFVRRITPPSATKG